VIGIRSQSAVAARIDKLAYLCALSRARSVVVRCPTRLETISDIIRVSWNRTRAARALYLGAAGIFVMPGDIVRADPVEDTTSICIVKSVPGTRPGSPHRKAEMDEKI